MMSVPSECCADCALFEQSIRAEPIREGICRLRGVDVLDAAWTVCKSFTYDESMATTKEPDGPIFVDAGAFPDHLLPVHDWPAYLAAERRKRE